MKSIVSLSCAFVLAAAGALAAPAGPSIAINSQAPGPTPFIATLDMTVSPPDGLKNIAFTIWPKPQSVTRPVAASYSSEYLRARGFLNTSTGRLTLPIFGLYQNWSNAVTVTTDFRQGRSQSDNVTVATAPWSDPTGGAYLAPNVIQPRSAADLSYDFIMLKGFAAGISPIIVDTDAEVRWVGTSGIASISAILYDNGIYVSQGSGITRMELDGAFRFVADYSGIGVTSTGHHNYDPGKNGFLVEVNTTAGVESTILEVDAAGIVLKTWKIADIVSAAMIAGGDDPSGFVRAPDDWFHNNAATYDRHEDAIIASGREDFVIALDYDTGAIQWILGDPTKKWYQYPSLRKYALTLEGASLPPIGEHAVSIGRDGDLLLFDNGRASLNQTPAGTDRSYSAPRKYRINSHKMTALETWSYQASPSLYSPYCSSVYEDGRGHYLMDYTLAGDVIGINSRDEMVFHYGYSTANFCGISWNAFPIHLEDMKF